MIYISWKSWMRYLVAALITLGLTTTGCSGTPGSTVFPGTATTSGIQQVHDCHMVWGYWQVLISKELETVQFIQLRTCGQHLNAVPLLEPPYLHYISIEGPPHFNGDILDVDIGIRHPAFGKIQYCVFDVCGIFITKGTKSGFSDPGIVMAGADETCLLNADGYSRWWNPVEFPVNTGTVYSYSDGYIGTPYAEGAYNATVNGYKYFCDDLDDPDDPLEDVFLENRGIFRDGQKNIRHYTIHLGDDDLIFNYALDVCWSFPRGAPPWSAPDDFPPQANRNEAWRISVTEIENTLWKAGGYGGGDLRLRVDVYDWYNAEMNTVRVESPGIFPLVESNLPTGGAPGYSTYEIEILDATPSEWEIDLFISVVAECGNFMGFIPDTNTTSYFTYRASVTPVTGCGSDPVLVASFPEWTGSAHGITSVGDLIFVADFQDFDAGLKIFDVSDKENPSMVGYYPCANANDIEVVGDRAYLSGWASTGLKILDISDVTDPILLGEAQVGITFEIEIRESYAYLADSYNGLLIVDISDEDNPELVITIGNQLTSGIDVEGDYAYISNRNTDAVGLQIVDITSKTEPFIVSALEIEGAYDVEVAGDIAFVASFGRGLVVVDIADKIDPVVIGEVYIYSAYQVTLVDDCAYVGCLHGPFTIVDVTDKFNPVIVGSLDSEKTFESAIAANYAYLAEGYDGLKVVKLW